MRLTKRVFNDLAIWMIGFGILIGVSFPFFTLLMGVSATIALSWVFFISCILAGVIVGLVNIVLTRFTVGNRLRIMTERMTLAKNHVKSIAEGDDSENCTPENCFIPVDSEDGFGESAQAFNQLIEAFSVSIQTQSDIRNYAETLSSQLDLEQLGKNALSLLMHHASAEAGAVLVETEGELKLISAAGIRDAQALANNSLVLNAFKEMRLLCYHLPEDIVLESVLTVFRPREVLVVPVKYKGIPLSVIVLASAAAFGAELAKELDIFANGLALALHNALAHEQLQKLAALDPLTGIYNRRFGLARLHEEFERSIRSGISIGVVMFDIDHFKQVNDTYGHVAGDRVLRTIARLARTALREEFLVILPGASKDDLFKICERLRFLIKDSQTAYGDSTIKVTVSIGCDAYPETDVATDQVLLVNADEALYRAKESGRDKVVLH
jgi:two-component system cell cycle response regulator